MKFTNYLQLSLLCLLLLYSGFANAQQTGDAATQKPGMSFWKPVYADCDSPVFIKIFKRQSYGPTVPPSGYGKRQEIRATKRNSELAFDQEHNTAWYLLKMYFDGEVIFDIIPQDSSNDYDFLLYLYKDSNFCSELASGKIKPIRSNIRRNDTATKGVTGLSSEGINELQSQGPGAQFSKSLWVKKGEQFMLVLDNVYPNGKGHTIEFAYRKEIQIAGTVTDERGKAIAAAEVSLTDSMGRVIAETKSDDSGKYRMNAKVTEFKDYLLTVFDTKHFFNEEVINTRSHNDSTLLNLRAALPDLKKGLMVRMRSINFYGDSPVPLPSAHVGMKTLYKLMTKNPGLQILIEGHVNAPGSDPEIERHQKLSEYRAQTISNYLKEKGIGSSRIQTIGMSSRNMLFPNAKSEKEQSANRRVEIKVVSM
jgi:outer membrane protein OmpA-like peptidoglycan-associated protein